MWGNWDLTAGWLTFTYRITCISKIKIWNILQHNGEKAMGVRIEKGSEIHVIHAPIIISTAGLYNTFLKLLPEPAAKNSYFYKVMTSDHIFNWSSRGGWVVRAVALQSSKTAILIRLRFKSRLKLTYHFRCKSLDCDMTLWFTQVVIDISHETSMLCRLI